MQKRKRAEYMREYRKRKADEKSAAAGENLVIVEITRERANTGENRDTDPLSNLQDFTDGIGSGPLEIYLDSVKQEECAFDDDENPSPVSSVVSTSLVPDQTNERSKRPPDDPPTAPAKRIRTNVDSTDDTAFEEDQSLVETDVNKTPKKLSDRAEDEHNMRLEILNMEFERAELQKQIAKNELRASEIRLQIAENRARELKIRIPGENVESSSQVRMVGERGSGAGKGGGGGGSIREAGGSFGKMEAAKEDQYFYNQQKEQLQNLREGLHDEISFHEEQIKRHQEAINRHKKRIDDMEHK